jgi:hypothetical protein
MDKLLDEYNTSKLNQENISHFMSKEIKAVRVSQQRKAQEQVESTKPIRNYIYALKSIL